MVRRVVRHYEGDWRALGVDIILAETADREQIRQSEYIWEVAGDPTKRDRVTPMMILSPAGAIDGPNCRAVVVPIPADSPLWGLEKGDQVNLLVDGQQLGAGVVNWSATIGSGGGLMEGQLPAMVRWAATGRSPGFERG